MNRQLVYAVAKVLAQLDALLAELSDELYTRQLPVLSGATAGEHTRHVVEFFLELEKGFLTGRVHYDGRQRDRRLARYRETARAAIHRITEGLLRENRELVLVLDGDPDELLFHTNYERELAYNLEHAVHHMALLKIGIGAVVELPENFGVAHSTARYRASLCAQ